MAESLNIVAKRRQTDSAMYGDDMYDKYMQYMYV